MFHHLLESDTTTEKWSASSCDHCKQSPPTVYQIAPYGAEEDFGAPLAISLCATCMRQLITEYMVVEEQTYHGPNPISAIS